MHRCLTGWHNCQKCWHHSLPTRPSFCPEAAANTPNTNGGMASHCGPEHSSRSALPLVAAGHRMVLQRGRAGWLVRRCSGQEDARTLDVVGLAAVEVAVGRADHIDARAVHGRGRRRHARAQHLASACTISTRSGQQVLGSYRLAALVKSQVIARKVHL